MRVHIGQLGGGPWIAFRDSGDWDWIPATSDVAPFSEEEQDTLTGISEASEQPTFRGIDNLRVWVEW